MQEIKANLSQRTAEVLRSRIEDGTYEPGSKLPNENELADVLSVSRTTLREAIRVLVNEGLLTVYRGRGTFVNKMIDQYADADMNIGNSADLKVTLRDLFEARMIIEPEAAAFAAVRATDEEIEEILKLREIVQQRILEDPAGQERIASESEFHGALMKASHNEFLSGFVSLLTLTIEKTFDLNENLDIIAQDAFKDHILIMDALKQRDAVALRSAVTIHLRRAVWNEGLAQDGI